MTSASCARTGGGRSAAGRSSRRSSWSGAAVASSTARSATTRLARPASPARPREEAGSSSSVSATRSPVERVAALAPSCRGRLRGRRRSVDQDDPPVVLVVLRSTRPRSSIRLTIPVALATETSSSSASRPIESGPCVSRTVRTWRWTRLREPCSQAGTTCIRSCGFHEVISSTSSAIRVSRSPGSRSLWC